jgi:hypothetical protein
MSANRRDRRLRDREQSKSKTVISFSVGKEPLICKNCNGPIVGACMANHDTTEFLCNKCYDKLSQL